MEQSPIAVGKLPAHLLERLLDDLAGLPAEVLIGPAIGEDACALELPGGVLVVATDPITLVRRDIGRHAVIVNANDVAVTGTRPRWFLATLLLPPSAIEPEIEGLFRGIREALAELGAVLVGGHSEVTPAVTQPVVVGQMLGLAENRRFISTGGTRPGDVIFQVGAAPIEGAAVLAIEARDRLDGLDVALIRRAAVGLEMPGISVVDAALAAAKLGATAMHDLTEGGLAGGLNELAEAASVCLRVERDRVLWFEPGLAVCGAVGADPWATLASGSMLASFDPADAGIASEALAEAGHEVATIAVAERGRGVRDSDGNTIAWPERDEVSRILES